MIAGDWTNWVVAGETVYYVDRDRSGSQRVSAFSPATGTSRVILGAVRSPMGTGGITSSADGERLVFAQLLHKDATLFRFVPR